MYYIDMFMAKLRDVFLWIFMPSYQKKLIERKKQKENNDVFFT